MLKRFIINNKFQNLLLKTQSYKNSRKNNTVMLSTEKLDPQQELLLKERCILVNETDSNIGSASKEECHLLGPNGCPPPLHRAFSVFLFNSNGELLLQQRSSHKITFPLHYTNTCCSHPLATEDEMLETDAAGVKKAALRRLIFELGIPEREIQLSDINYLTRIYYSSPSLSGKWGEHEIDYILFMKKNVTLNPNLNEIKEVQYVSRENFENLIANLVKNNVPITPWFQMIIDKFLLLWWDNLDNLSKFVDHKSIHRM
ncbi:Isopentenyl-diphosphate Delta-isomerase 1 [Armadillidium nasatum]|uniref:isopentenyl-diphosphate Delta-isomerase n=1 Tax=Armadillidium nasatum TaxID=96803 RepID=A0A5N5TKE8_9CRUS|nr:Isopentenyl-diphosphate Delta-isomerase 1 [Armadillidium nasatum]